jgi:hypothetical protein
MSYTIAPWTTRLSFWLAARFWCWCQSFAELSALSPDLANPLWRK